MTIKFENIKTGEIVEVAFNDHEKLNEIMGSKEYRLIFC